MTTQQKIEAIRQKCIEANPEIVELKFGCQLKLQDFKEFPDYPAIYAGEVWDEKRQDWKAVCLHSDKHLFSLDREYEIIGRPIRLVDVLLALHEAPRTKNVGITTLIGSMVLESFTKDDLRKAWNLYKDSLEEQSKETIDFIHDLLK